MWVKGVLYLAYLIVDSYESLEWNTIETIVLYGFEGIKWTNSTLLG